MRRNCDSDCSSVLPSEMNHGSRLSSTPQHEKVTKSSKQQGRNNLYVAFDLARSKKISKARNPEASKWSPLIGGRRVDGQTDSVLNLPIPHLETRASSTSYSTLPGAISATLFEKLAMYQHSCWGPAPSVIGAS